MSRKKEKNSNPPHNKTTAWDLDPAVLEFFELATDKHSRLQTSLGKVRRYVIFIKGSAEGRNSSRMREIDGILSLMAEQRG